MLIGALSPGISHAPIFSLSLVFFSLSLSLSQLSNRRRFTFLYFNKPRVHERPRIHAQVALILYLPLRFPLVDPGFSRRISFRKRFA